MYHSLNILNIFNCVLKQISLLRLQYLWIQLRHYLGLSKCPKKKNKSPHTTQRTEGICKHCLQCFIFASWISVVLFSGFPECPSCVQVYCLCLVLKIGCRFDDRYLKTPLSKQWLIMAFSKQKVYLCQYKAGWFIVKRLIRNSTLQL